MDRKCTNCDALYQKLVERNSQSDVREEELQSQLHVANLQVQALSREIVSLRHRLGGAVSQSIAIQTEDSSSVEVAVQTDDMIVAPFSPFRANLDPLLTEPVRPNNTESDYVEPVNLADEQYQQDQNTWHEFTVDLVGANQQHSAQGITLDLSARALDVLIRLRENVHSEAPEIPFLPAPIREVLEELEDREVLAESSFAQVSSSRHNSRLSGSSSAYAGESSRSSFSRGRGRARFVSASRNVVDERSEDDFVRFQDRPSTSAAGSSWRTPSPVSVHSANSANTLVPFGSSSRDRSPLSSDGSTADEDQELRCSALAQNRERALIRRRMIDDFEEHPPAVISPLQEIQFAQTTMRHGLAFFPIGFYVFVVELNRRIRVVVDMRPASENVAAFALFEGTSAEIQPVTSPHAVVANYMPGNFSTPVIRQQTVIHLRDRNMEFPVPVSLTRDWSTERLVISCLVLQHRLSDVDIQHQTFRLRYSSTLASVHDFFWHTGVIEQSSNTQEANIARDLVRANQDALRHSRNRRRNQ